MSRLHSSSSVSPPMSSMFSPRGTMKTMSCFVEPSGCGTQCASSTFGIRLPSLIARTSAPRSG